MHRPFAAALLTVALGLSAAPSAIAQDCQFGTRLSSTLLIPYFEVDPGAPGGLTTLFSVTSESSAPTLVRVILWTDWGMPTLGFDVYLDRFDLQTFNLRDLFLGNLPSTGQGAAGLAGFWRDVGTPEVDPIPCGTKPSWYPLGLSFVTARDETASEASKVDVGAAKPHLFPLATQKVPASALGVPYSFGRVQMGLGNGPGLSNPRQAWVQTLFSASGRFSVGLDARAIDELCDETVP